MSESFIRIGVWLTAIICALTGLASIFYGYIAIYSLSGFTSIFIGAIIVLIALGLIKRHAVARIGAYLVLVVSSIGCLMWLFLYQYNPNTQIKNIGTIEYFCLLYIFIAVLAVLFLSIKATREYFSVYTDKL